MKEYSVCSNLQIMYIRDDYVTEHIQNLSSIPPKEFLIPNRTLIQTNLLHVCLWRDSPQWARASFFTRFPDHTQRRITVGRTPLDERSACRRDLYLTTHNTHDTHPCPRWDSNPKSQQASGRRPTP